jgi:hypothetical protein
MTRSTPETDSFLRNLNDYSDIELRAMTEHARKLERERDELRRMSVVELMGENLNVKHHVTEWENRCLKAERERDEARAERDILQVMRKEVVAANKGAKINAQVSNSLAGKLNRAESERDEWRKKFELSVDAVERAARLAEAESERDEAREAFVIATDQIVIAQSNLREANKERDEARGEQCSIQCAFEESQDKIEKLECERDEAIELLKIASWYSTTTTQEITEKFLRKIGKWEETK